MKTNVEELAKTYYGMREEEFENIDWIDLTEEARPFYEKELQRRNPSQWRDVIAERKECLARSALNRPTESVLSSEGRLNRQDYALRVFSVNGGVLAFSLLARAALSLGWNLPSDGVVSTGIDVQQIIALAAILLGVAGSAMIAIQAIKRLHDLCRPGSHVLLMFVPLLGLYLSLVLLFKKGTTGPNRYGDDPIKETDCSAVANVRQAPQR